MRVHEAELEEELTRITGTHFTPGAVEDIPLRFHEFAPADSAPDLIAVDGSYSFLLNLASWWLAILTVGALRYSFNGGYTKAAQRVNHRVVAVSTLEEYVAKQTEIHRHIFEFTQGSKDQHNEMVNEFRRWEEAKLSMQMAADHDGMIVAVDGTLASFPKEYDLMKDVVRECEQHGHLLVGVSKDSDLHAFGSVHRDEDVLRRRQGGLDGCAYVRAPETAEARQKMLLYGDIYYARLHPNAPKWFRIDLGTMKDRPEEAFARLAAYGRARHSLGYPLPLLEAHRLAVTVRHFQPIYEQAVLRTASHLGMDLREVVHGLTRVEGKRKSAFHEYLDRVTEDRR